MKSQRTVLIKDSFVNQCIQFNQSKKKLIKIYEYIEMGTQGLHLRPLSIWSAGIQDLYSEIIKVLSLLFYVV